MANEIIIKSDANINVNNSPRNSINNESFSVSNLNEQTKGIEISVGDNKVNNQANITENKTNQFSYSLNNVDLPNQKPDDIKITILGKLEQDLFTIDEEKAKKANICVKANLNELFDTVRLNNIYVKDINYTITVTDPYIKKIQDSLNNISVVNNKTQAGTNQSDAKLNDKLDIFDIAKIKLEKVLQEVKEKILESKMIDMLKNVFKEHVYKMKKIIEEYEIAIKDIWGDENNEEDKKEQSSFAVFNNEEKGYIIFKDPRASKNSSNKSTNYYNIRERMYKSYEVKGQDINLRSV